MKKGWKIFWITCSVVAVLGITLCVAGVAMGGDIASAYEAAGGRLFRNRSHTSNYHDYQDDYNDYDDDNDYDDYDDYDDENQDNYDGTHHNGKHHGGRHHGRVEKENYFEETIDGIESLDMDIAASEIYIVPGNEGEVKVVMDHFAGRHCGIDVRSEGKKLYVESRSENGWCFKDHLRDKREVTIYVPKEMTEMNLILRAGTLVVEDARLDQLNLEVAAGSAHFQNLLADNAKVDCAAGAATIYGDVYQSLEIDCSAGEVLFFSESGKESYNYSIDCSTGSIELDGERQRGESEISNQAGRTMDIECEVGKVGISFDK